MRYVLLLALLLGGCGSGGDLTSVSAPATVSAPALDAAASKALAHVLLRPGLISLTEGLVAIRKLGTGPGPRAGYLEVTGDRMTFTNWSAEAEEVNGTVIFGPDGQDYVPGFTYAALDGSVRDVIAGGTARLRDGVWTLDVDTTDQVARARTVTHRLRFTQEAVDGQVELYTPTAQGIFTVTTTNGVVTASSPLGTLYFPVVATPTGTARDQSFQVR